MRIEDAHKAVDFIRDNARPYAQARANRVYLEEFRKSKKALLMGESDAKTAVEREQFAYSHPDYIEVIEGLKQAVETEEELRWKMVAAQARVEVIRSQEASARMEVKATT